MKRLHNLDYLRGLAAFGILLYHYLSWTIGRFDSESTIGRIGLYGVSIFYILSGLTLFIVYYEKMNFSKNEIIGFIKKRVFRIFPLMWLVVIISILFSQKVPNVYDLIMNLTGLFGFVNWDKYFAVGLWSIGNELVFYAFFITFLYFALKKTSIFYVYSLIVFLVFSYFAFYILKNQSSKDFTLIKMWWYYVNPLNQLFLFLGGFLIGYFFNVNGTNKNLNIFLLIFGLFIFAFYPENGDKIFLVSGTSRIVFTFSSLLICFGFFKVNFNFTNFIHVPLVFLGEICYSLYLIHPLVFNRVRFVADYLSAHYFKISSTFVLIISIFLTLILSSFIYKYFEKHFIKLGNNRFYLK
jgi:peptidoglycan/LPS O-acetylase OafA/YrhL